jgi:hypothetical protein
VNSAMTRPSDPIPPALRFVQRAARRPMRPITHPGRSPGQRIDESTLARSSRRNLYDLLAFVKRSWAWLAWAQPSPSHPNELEQTSHRLSVYFQEDEPRSRRGYVQGKVDRDFSVFTARVINGSTRSFARSSTREGSIAFAQGRDRSMRQHIANARARVTRARAAE